MDRRAFLIKSTGAALASSLSADLLAQQRNPPQSGRWDRGQVRHLLPTVSDTKILIKSSFERPLSSAPRLRIGSTSVVGRMCDTTGEFWRFYAGGLQPGRTYALSLAAANGSTLCEPWNLATFPQPDAAPDHVRILFFTCEGGQTGDSGAGAFLPASIRNRLLRRALSFEPQAAVANGDHVYWDLHPVRTGNPFSGGRLASFSPFARVFGDRNEGVLKVAAGPQIVPVYGTDFRSTPTFFLPDDHDYFDNDEATDQIITFPPDWFRLQLARATQLMYYPEFLPDVGRPEGLPWSSANDRTEPVSECFGTLRYGRLLEVLLYDVRRTVTLSGPSAVFIDQAAEKWVVNRSADAAVTHLIQAPSNPWGWSAGKWGEWYPDILGADGKLTTAMSKPYWQPGWLAQHDRLIQAANGMKGRIPMMISGDLHAIGYGTIVRAGMRDLRTNPVAAILSGPIGTGPGGWPSAFRGIGPIPPAHLDVQEDIKPIEQHGFTIADFYPDRVQLRFFKWDVKTQLPEAIDSLEPFQTRELGRPA